MLVLTRRLGESITIGDNVRVVVMEIRGNQVRLGIEAPHDLPVHREEVYRKILQENQRAASQSPQDLGEVASAWKTRTAGRPPREPDDRGNR